MPQKDFVSRSAVVASTMSFFIGCQIGVTNGAVQHLKESKIIQELMEVVTGIINILSLFSLVLVAWIFDRIGRRHAILSSGGMFLLGNLLLSFTRTYAVLMVGRLFTNISIGYVLVVTPIYIAEISPTNSRGKLSSLPEVFFNAGIVIGKICNYVLSNVSLNHGWQVMLTLGGISSYLLSIGILAMPESPRWLIMEGRLEDGKIVLDTICESNEEAAHWLADIKKAAGIPVECNDSVVDVTRQSSRNNLWQIYPTRSLKHMLLCTLALHIFRQASGIDIVINDPRIFKKSSITDSDMKIFAAITVDFIKTACMLFPTFLLDRMGRRPLMLLSMGGMLLSLVSLGSWLNVIDDSNTEFTLAVAMSIVSALLYVVTFSIGLGPVTSVYSSEVFPLRLQTQGSAVGVGIEQAISGVSSAIFLWLCDTITFGGTAFLYATIACIMWVGFYMMVPETNGWKLEETGQLFGSYFNWSNAARQMMMERTNRVDGDAIMLRPPSRAL